MRSTILKRLGVASIGLFAVTGPVLAAGVSDPPNGALVVQLAANDGPDLAMPAMDPVRGKQLFASKGCVVCHSINGVGGTDAPNLDASTMTPRMNPFDFFAKMWHGAEPMIIMQRSEIGQQIEFTGQDLADIVSFVHDAAVQKTFSETDIPAAIKAYMEGDEGDKDKAARGTMGPGMGGNLAPRQGMGSGMGSGMMGGSRMGR